MFQFSFSSLLVFEVVARTRSFSKAAQILSMTQPGVSNHIAQLEAQTGLGLIRRDRGGCDLTTEGKIVYRYAEKIEKLGSELEAALRALRKDVVPVLRVGTTVNYAKKIMPFILGDFQMRNPGARIKLDAGASVEMERTLLLGQNDVIIVANQHASRMVRSFPFVREELVLVVRRDHPLAARKAVSLPDIQRYPLIIREEGSATRRVVLDAFSGMGIVPTVLIEANSSEFIKEWVSRGEGVSILIERAINPEEDTSLTTVPLLEPLFLEVAVHYLKSKEYDPSIQKFIRYMKELTENPDPAAVLERSASEAMRTAGSRASQPTLS